MSEWITDRLPTAEDADQFGDVWVTLDNKYVADWNWRSVRMGTPWQPTAKPIGYHYKKRWTVMGDEINDTVALAEFGQWRFELCGLTAQHYAAAQRIADIYNEVLP